MQNIKRLLLLVLFTISLSSYTQREDTIFTDYQIDEFFFEGKKAKVVVPNINPNGQWIWRARFWGHEPQSDKTLLDFGFHVLYIDVIDLFGNMTAVELWNNFYEHCREKYKLNKKVVLEGMSRGGLIIYNWAAENTDKVACIYADAPVCDIKSWPGGLFQSSGSEEDWETCLKVHNLNEKSVMDFEGIPLYTSRKVAQANIPVLHVCGDSDKVVPYKENTGKLKEIFEAEGGSIHVILKKGIGHHPHSLKNPKPIVDFILEHTLDKK